PVLLRRKKKSKPWRGRASDRRDERVLRSRSEQRRLGEAASLLRDRNFVKGPGANPTRAMSMLRLGFGFVRECTTDVAIRHPLGSAVPLIESLKSKTTE